MNTGKNQKNPKSILKSTFFAVLILLTAVGITNNAKSAEAEFKAKSSDLKEFVKLNNINSYYNKLLEMFGKDDLPLLYELIKDEEYAPYWHNIANVIGIISDDPNSVPVLLEYFQRDEGSKVYHLLGKICTIEWIGLIGGDMADSILQKAVTREGSIELAKDWIEDGLWTDKNLSKELLIGYIQGCAMKGLVFTRKPENIKVVEKIYTQEKNRVIEEKSGKVRGYLIDAMAANDYISDHDGDIGAFLRRDPEIDFSFREYIRKYRVSIPEEDSANTSSNDKANELREYVKLGGVSYEYSREKFGRDQLPVLYELLRDENYAQYWHNVATVIGYISNDSNSVPVLLDYFQRDDGMNINDQSRFLGKIWSLAWMGKIGSKTADSILRKAVTEEGAEELAKNWIDKELWRTLGNSRERTVVNIQEAAIHGLVYSGKQENLDFVEKFYNQQKDISIKNKATSDLMNTLISAMAKKDYIANHGIGEFFHIDGKETLYLPGLMPYLDKYNIIFPFKAAFDDSYIDPKELFKTKWIGGLTYSKVIKSFSPESVPVLHEMLEDTQYFFHWYNIAVALCYISKDPNSVEEIVKYIQRPKELSNEGFDVIGKGRILSSIGFIKNNKVNDFLTKALTADGAAELTKSWIDKTQDYNDTVKTKEEMFGFIRGSAAIGLIHSQFPTNIRLVEQLYEKEYAMCKEQRIYTELFNQLVDAMAIRDLIEDIGIEEYLKLQGKEHNRLSPYIVKYDLRSLKIEAEEIANAINSNFTPGEYIKRDGQWAQVRYGTTRAVITKDKLPILYKLLDDDEYAPYWHKVVAAIGYASDDPNSVNVLLKFIRRNDNSKVDMHSIMGKSWAFAMIGLIGGDTADSVLRKGVTKEGAKEFTQSWINETLPGKVDNEGMITFIQQHSITGLIYSGKPENLALVEKLYNEQKKISIKNHERTELMSDLISSMAEKDYIADVGLETHLNEFNSGLDTGAMTPYLNKYRFSLNEKESAEAEFRAKYSDLKEYIKLGDVLYSRTREMFGKDSLPLLYELLKDDAYAPYWHTVAQVIGFISDDPNSVPVLLNYFQRDDGAKNFSMSSKIWSIAWMGKIGGSLADSVLKKALTEEGARELVKDWIDEELWQDKFFQEHKDIIIPTIRYNALKGLVFSGKQENLDFVIKLYNENMDISLMNKKRTDLMSPLTDAMAAKDYIADHGIDGFFAIWHSDDGKYIMPYVQKYSFAWRMKSITDKSVKAASDDKDSDLREYVKQNRVSYDRTREMFGKNDLPKIYELLKDDDYAPYWTTVTDVICYISDSNDSNSVQILLDYFQRNDGAKAFSLLGKIWSLAWMGKIGNDLSDSILRKALTEEGARELAKNWINEELWQEKYFKEHKDRVIPNIRYAALQGLAFSGTKENLDFVEKLYNEQKDISIKNKAQTDIMDALINAMAIKTYIAEHGIEGYFKISNSDNGSILGPYYKKYRFEIGN
jgi:hypothetical protein